MPTVPRPAEDVAGYVVTAVDDTGSKTITEAQLKSFLDGVVLLAARKIDKARESFAANATEKGGLNLPEAYVGPVMTIGQFFEILMLMLLPLALARLGFTWTIAIGIARLGIALRPVLAGPAGVAGAGLAGAARLRLRLLLRRLHDLQRPHRPQGHPRQRQGIIILVSFGFGMLVSSLVAGPIADYFEYNWHYIFLAPVAVLVVCTIVFLIGFRPEPAVQEAAGDKPTPPAEQDVIPATEEQKYL